jgi:enoyl-CoA hydratase/carnithine racemase
VNSFVLVETRGLVHWITIDRPKNRNVINEEVITANRLAIIAA